MCITLVLCSLHYVISTCVLFTGFTIQILPSMVTLIFLNNKQKLLLNKKFLLLFSVLASSFRLKYSHIASGALTSKCLLLNRNFREILLIIDFHEKCLHSKNKIKIKQKEQEQSPRPPEVAGRMRRQRKTWTCRT